VTVDWERYQKCRVCFAALGRPCVKAGGFFGTPSAVEADKPHSSRKLRAGR
jgi:hypothetical protein